MSFLDIYLVDHIGFEPMTPCMSSKCSNRAELMIQMYGARNRDRTCDLELRRLLLYPTELSGRNFELRRSKLTHYIDFFRKEREISKIMLTIFIIE